jgi:hypothetical protein
VERHLVHLVDHLLQLAVLALPLCFYCHSALLCLLRRLLRCYPLPYLLPLSLLLRRSTCHRLLPSVFCRRGACRRLLFALGSALRGDASSDRLSLPLPLLLLELGCRRRHFSGARTTERLPQQRLRLGLRYGHEQGSQHCLPARPSAIGKCTKKLKGPSRGAPQTDEAPPQRPGSSRRAEEARWRQSGLHK